MCGEILKVDAQGGQSRSWFDESRLWYGGGVPCLFSFDYGWSDSKRRSEPREVYASHTQALKSVAGAFGFSPWEID